MTDANMTEVYPGLHAVRRFLIKHWATYAAGRCA